MTIDASLVQRLKDALDVRGALDFLRRAIGTPSVTGEEAAFARMLADELTALGAAEIALEDFAPSRPNVRGVLKGATPGPRLLLTGHTDTVHVRGWSERWKGTERESPFSGALLSAEIGPVAPYFPQAKSPSESVPQMPQIPCTGTAPIGSSIRSHSSRSIPRITTTPATPPSRTAPVGLTQ